MYSHLINAYNSCLFRMFTGNYNFKVHQTKPQGHNIILLQKTCGDCETKAGSESRCMHVNKTFKRSENLANKVFFIVLEKNNRFSEYSAQIRSKTGFTSEFDPQTHSEILKYNRVN